MQRLLCFLLIYTMAGITFQLDELIKLPVLVKHYYYHSQITDGETILHFLYSHYVQNTDKESSKDQQENSQLPFKSGQDFHSYFNSFIINHSKFVSFISFVAILEFPDYNIISSFGYADIWKPPQVV